MDLKTIVKDLNLTDNEQYILKYLVANIDALEGVKMRDLAKELYTSPASIIRLAKKLNFSGYIELYYYLRTKRMNANISKKSEVRMNDYDLVLNMANFGSEIHETLATVQTIINNHPNQMVLICATGFSGIIANYMYKKLLVKGVRTLFSTAEDSSGIVRQNLHATSIFIGISRSGETEKMIEKLQLCQNKNIPTLVITGDDKSHLARLADAVIIVPDGNKLDTHNITYNDFYVQLLYLLENITQRQFI